MPEVIYTKEKIEQILKEYGYTAIGEIKNIRTKILTNNPSVMMKLCKKHKRIYVF